MPTDLMTQLDYLNQIRTNEQIKAKLHNYLFFYGMPLACKLLNEQKPELSKKAWADILESFFGSEYRSWINSIVKYINESLVLHNVFIKNSKLSVLDQAMKEHAPANLRASLYILDHIKRIYFPTIL